MIAEPLVSIIINNYNYGGFLKEAINSALNQTYKNIEVIVVDDGSTDNSREIITSFGSRIIAVLKENGGQASAYNAGFAKSSGEFICNFDSDDILFSEAIEKVIPEFKNKNIIKVQWPLSITNKEGHATGEITTKWTPPEGDLKDLIFRDGPFYDFYLTTGCTLKRTFLQEVLPMPEAPYKIGADEYLVTLAPLYGEIKNIMQPLGIYRSHGGNHYMGRSIDEERLKVYMQRFEDSCDMLANHAKKLGYEVEQELWKQRNFNYVWPQRLLEAKKSIKIIIPEQSKYILVNQDEWGGCETDTKPFALPFMELEGKYDGLPATDEDAINEVKRLRECGAEFTVFWWTSFWMLDHYIGLSNYLHATYQRIFEDDSIIIYDLRSFKERRAIIMCAGKASRFNGVRKHLLQVNDEPILHRTVRLLKECGVEDIWVSSSDPEYEMDGVVRYAPINNVYEIDRFYSLLPCWKGDTIFLYGDCYYTQSAILKILETTDDFLFFGRPVGSVITGSKHGEIFALRFTNHQAVEAGCLYIRNGIIDGSIKRGIGWDLYRYLMGKPVNGNNIIYDHFVEINDFTDDFDTEDDYTNWMERYQLYGNNETASELAIAEINSAWYDKLRAMTEEISLIPGIEKFILIDDEKLFLDIVDDFKPLPFLQQKGMSRGGPGNDEIAISELKKLKKEGLAYLVFAWPAFWWIDYYYHFVEYLNTSFIRVLESERVIVFDIRNDRLKINSSSSN